MAVQYTISQLANAAEIPTSTLRYYERIRLLEPDSRSASNYRIYGEESRRRLAFIRASQAVGFTLGDIAKLLALQDSSPTQCGQVQGLIESRLQDLQEQMKNLRHVSRVLKSLLGQCRQTERDGKCHVIDRLGRSAKSERRNGAKPRRSRR